MWMDFAEKKKYFYNSQEKMVIYRHKFVDRELEHMHFFLGTYGGMSWQKEKLTSFTKRDKETPMVSA